MLEPEEQPIRISFSFVFTFFAPRHDKEAIHDKIGPILVILVILGGCCLY
jgi:hypothetical protein